MSCEDASESMAFRQMKMIFSQIITLVMVMVHKSFYLRRAGSSLNDDRRLPHAVSFPLWAHGECWLSKCEALRLHHTVFWRLVWVTALLEEILKTGHQEKLIQIFVWKWLCWFVAFCYRQYARLCSFSEKMCSHLSQLGSVGWSVCFHWLDLSRPLCEEFFAYYTFYCSVIYKSQIHTYLFIKTQLESSIALNVIHIHTYTHIPTHRAMEIVTHPFPC